jgi:hypothetical protein
MNHPEIGKTGIGSRRAANSIYFGTLTWGTKSSVIMKQAGVAG